MTDWVKPTLTIGIILEEIDLFTYLAKDIFNNTEAVITITGKERLHWSFEKGDFVYFAKSSLKPEKGRLITPAGMKKYPYLSSLKKLIDEKFEDYKQRNFNDDNSGELGANIKFFET